MKENYYFEKEPQNNKSGNCIKGDKYVETGA